MCLDHEESIDRPPAQSETASLNDDGAVAQLVERFHGMEEAARSSRVSSTVVPVPAGVAEWAPSEVGARAEAAVVAALVRAGIAVYLPMFGAHARVDLICEDDQGFHRVQCKTSRVVGDVVVFSTCSNSKQVRRDYRGEADLFGVYSPELDEVFLVPVEAVPKRAGSLRLGPTRNRQQKGIRWAKDYVIGRLGPRQPVDELCGSPR